MAKTNWTKICQLSAAFNILSLLVFTALLGVIAARKVTEQIEERMIDDVWVDVPILWPSLITAILTFLLLKMLNNTLKKVFVAINLGLGLVTFYYIYLVL